MVGNAPSTRAFPSTMLSGSGRGNADGVQEVLRQDVLDEEAGGSGAQCVEDILVQPVVGQNDDVHRVQGRIRRDAPGGLDAVDLRHPDVEEYDVG